MRVSIFVHIARSLIAACAGAVAGVFIPLPAPSAAPSGEASKPVQIAQSIIAYFPSTRWFWIAIALYATVLFFLSYRIARHLTLSGALIWGVLVGVYVHLLVPPQDWFGKANDWLGAQLADLGDLPPWAPTAAGILLPIVLLIVIPVLAAFLLSRVRPLLAR